jgi:uncharacterized protein
MIVDFSVKNYRSIRDLETLAMNAAKIVSKDKELDESNLIPFSDKLSLLKSKAIYGANASGKSTMIRALASFLNIIFDSVKDEKILLRLIDRHLLANGSISDSTYFQLSFIYRDIYYRYGFEANTKIITAEWLFGTPGKKEVPFFIREGSEITVNENQFPEGSKLIDLYKQSDNDIARPNSLFLSVCRSFNQGLAREIVEYLTGYVIISGLGDRRMLKMAEDSLTDEQQRKKMAEWLKLADTGIDDIYLHEVQQKDEKKSPTIYLTKTRRKQLITQIDNGEPLEFYMVLHESEGTQKMFEIGPAIFQALELGRVLVLDEFDARLHPLLSRKIVGLFNSKANLNAQFIFATHDTNLLDAKLLRRDQICFVEKDSEGASHFYSLVDFKGIRNDASYEKDYIAGRYGAIPFLGDFKSLLES